MRDTGNKDLRRLAHDYYVGDLSYESYRSARTQLLDSITAVAGADDYAGSTTRHVNIRGETGQSLAHHSARSRYLRGAIWMLIVILIALILMALIMLPLGQSDPADTAVSGAAAKRAGIYSVEDYRTFNG